MTDEIKARVGDLLHQARKKREAARVAIVECRICDAADLHREAQGMEAEAEEHDRAHESPAWHIE